jgi:Putative zinc-finger/HEAT repeats
MECEEVRNRFADYLTGELAGQARAEFEAHVVSCPACRADTEGLDQIWEGLGELPSEPFDRAAMRARFDEMLDTYRQGLEDARTSGVRPGATDWLARWSRQPVVQAALAALLLIAGVLAGALLPRPAPTQGSEITELRRELHDMREMLTLSLMQQQSAAERLRGVSWSNQIDKPGNEIVGALLDTLLHDPNVNVRLASVDALKRFSMQADVRLGTLRALTEASSPMLQVAIIDFMVETRDTSAVGALQRLARDATANESVRGRAAWGLEKLSS